MCTYKEAQPNAAMTLKCIPWQCPFRFDRSIWFRTDDEIVKGLVKAITVDEEGHIEVRFLHLDDVVTPVRVKHMTYSVAELRPEDWE